ncbi:U3 small nucleolar RNA-associated protein 6 [Ceratocystis platani]|uniref:U3 small nucleolar RNA-associated protein 6 n=1 Tax=Ceratocystis fimbriata f. sp. platani TaxID=88771 RepID=A0A0F8BQ12_CERFI|nr:U3 small nucleolar RNA-associated protein 6 [Ceratocystis platani]
MAGVSEKARFYLEKAVPQLREWEDKSIFTKDEIRTIVQKRSDFEHRVLSPGNTPSDYLEYADWEKTLDSLRIKRCQRLKIRNLSSAHTAQVKLLSIYDRGVGRHPGHRSLWVAYLDYAASIKATKRWRLTVTRALRMRPTDAGLWIMAANKMAGHGDMASARRFYMRACRFCVYDGTVWAEYARCEMVWLAKLALKNSNNKGAKPIDAVKPDQVDENDRISLGGSDDESDSDDDEIVRADASGKAAAIFSTEAKQELTNPALDGALPLAIFKIARNQKFWDANAAELFFNVFTSFRGLPAHENLVQAVMDSLHESFPQSPVTLICQIRRPVAGISPLTADFPRGLREIVPLLKEALVTANDKKVFGEKATQWLDDLLATKGLDADIAKVLEYLKSLAMAVA